MLKLNCGFYLSVSNPEKVKVFLILGLGSHSFVEQFLTSIFDSFFNLIEFFSLLES